MKTVLTTLALARANAKTIVNSCDAAPVVPLAGAVILLAASVVPVSAANEFEQTNLVSDIPGMAQNTDPNLINPWGIADGGAFPFWVANNGTGVTTIYQVNGTTAAPVPFVVTIPPATGATTAAPTGQVFNGGSGFSINGNPTHFLFDSEDGAISGWSAGTSAVIAVNNGNTDPSKNAVYKGLAISDLNGGTLYATNFRSGDVEMYNSSFTLTNSFADPTLPAGYAPFNAKVLNGELYVTFALQDAAKHDDVAGPGNGFVDIFDLHGNLLTHLISKGPLDSLWGLEIAPSTFGMFAGDLLVGNFGNGMINAFNATTGAFAGTLDGTNGMPLVIGDLWSLSIGDGAPGGGAVNTVYFTSGIAMEADGLFGGLTAVPELSTWAMLLLGFAALGFAGYRSKWARTAAA
jgi:uncharacterized protein (TIGR03118 family)